MTKADLTNKVTKALNINQIEAENSVCAVLATIKQGIIEDGNVTIRGFGSFNTRNKAKRIGRNPKTGEPATITARRIVKFKAYNPFKNQVNQGDIPNGGLNS